MAVRRNKIRNLERPNARRATVLALQQNSLRLWDPDIAKHLFIALLTLFASTAKRQKLINSAAEQNRREQSLCVCEGLRVVSDGADLLRGSSFLPGGWVGDKSMASDCPQMEMSEHWPKIREAQK
ncbi:unnamed protein product [Calypogeia fissa]